MSSMGRAHLRVEFLRVHMTCTSCISQGYAYVMSLYIHICICTVSVLSICKCICIHTYMPCNMCVHTYTHYIYAYVYIHIDGNIHVCICRYICMAICIYACVCVFSNAKYQISQAPALSLNLQPWTRIHASPEAGAGVAVGANVVACSQPKSRM